MHSSVRASFLGLAIVMGACTDPSLELEARARAAEAAPAGFLFAVSGTHVEKCVGTKCPTMWAESPSPNNCGGGFEPAESYIVHQRGVDWDGVEGEAELHGEQYRLTQRLAAASLGGEPPGTLRTMHNQSVIIQCCPAVSPELRPQRPEAFIDMKVCPDRCDAPSGLCPITLPAGSDARPFGTCRTAPQWLIVTDRCDLAVAEAGWRDPHAPHDLTDPSGEDKRVFNVYYRAAWSDAP